MRLAALFSGGKDSVYAVYRALKDSHDVKYLIVFVPENPDSYMFHHPNVNFTELQGEVMGINVIKVNTKGVKEKELEDIRKALKKIKGEIDGVCAGALASKYQYGRVKGICDSLGLKVYTPAWESDPERYMEELVEGGFEFIITKVAADGLSEDWLGKVVTMERLNELRILSRKHGFHIAFEGGEAETFVLDCPIFTKRLLIGDFSISWDEKTETGTYNIKRLEAVEKDQE